MRLAWTADPHLEWLNDTLSRFLLELEMSETEGLIISGDISNANQIKKHLRRLAQLPMPVYFVLGNHDIYGSSFDYVHKMVRRSVRDHKNLTWLTESQPIQLTDKTYLIGHDGWADGRAGIGQRSGFLLNDYKMISDFRGLSIGSTFQLMEEKADWATQNLVRKIWDVRGNHILLVTHAPPWEEACRYNGKASSSEFLPHFSNIGLGKALEQAAEETGSRITVLCGHTHEQADITINPRIGVRTLWAQYGNPTFTTIDVDTGC